MICFPDDDGKRFIKFAVLPTMQLRHTKCAYKFVFSCLIYFSHFMSSFKNRRMPYSPSVPVIQSITLRRRLIQLDAARD